MTHLHIFSWVLALALLALVSTFLNSGNLKPAKISHMILRLDYLLILYSGGDLFASYSSYGPAVIIKLLVGIWVIASIEMVAVKKKKGQKVTSWWTQLTISVLLALFLGFVMLPMGILP
ncbi:MULTISPECIES: YisL family protein [Salimicrobium]|uniref:Uncharacterized protein n=1 Tax=Salimicrobium humidisoli TaxID=2029857 RepID=A0ABX4HSD6_9BACI|nr:MULTISPECIES: YisL family protein [Salimicrobium]PBB06104.1 hypothetical protein CKW00_04945 [Salimicrobium humidisoli]